jgi:hypothetical protein
MITLFLEISYPLVYRRGEKMNSKKFVPQIGQLVTRTTVDHSDGSIEMLLLFHDKNDLTDHYQALARLQDGKTEPFFGGYMSDSGDEVTITTSGDVIIRSPASYDNLCIMSRTWNGRSYDREGWYAKILTIPGLLVKETVEIDRAFALGHTF